MIGNAHIDPVWLWQWQEGLHEVRATFRSALERMDEYGDFIFTCDSVAYLEWVHRVEPELFGRIAERVREGRFVVVGGWWIEPDCNLPHGESLVRQALYAQRFLVEHFGSPATVGCNVDPFGHAATLPQLLAKAGIGSYMFLRPEPKEKTLPAELFWWASPDGSRVLAYRIPYSYNGPAKPLEEYIDQVLERAPAHEEQLMVFYGVGNHGGGPTRANLDSIARMDAAGRGLRLTMSSPQTYLDAMAQRADLPTYVGDLQHHAVGCYSAHSGVKRWNRRAEHLLMAAERWSAVATQLGGPAYPAAELARAWKVVLFNQFHDTLAGTAIAPAYQDARDQYGFASTVAADAANLAVQSVTGRIDLPPGAGTLPIVALNPLPWAVQADVEFELEPTAMDEYDAVDEESGAAVAVQRVRSLATLGGRHRRLVLAAEVPGLGYRTYRLRPRSGPDASPPPGPARSVTDAGGNGAVLENDFLLAEIDPGSGWLCRLFDKRRGAELVAGRGTGTRRLVSHAVVLEDRSDTWGHDVVAYDDEIGHFTCTSVRRTEAGPVRDVVEVRSKFGTSTLLERFVLGGRAAQLEVRVTLDWRERQRALKLRFPTALSRATATFSVPYGHIERPTAGSEEVAQAWVDVSGVLPDGDRAGWAVLNDGKYAFDVRGAEIGMTVARSPVFAWHEPHKLEPEASYEYLDQGFQDFTYALVPHHGDWRSAAVPRRAEELNEPVFAVPEHFHSGSQPPAQSFADDGAGPVMVSVIKQAEDGGALVVRAYETAGRPGPARVELGLLGRTLEADFAPGEVKTFLVPHQDGPPVKEVSLLEW
jgi:alpha-mannosidase